MLTHAQSMEEIYQTKGNRKQKRQRNLSFATPLEVQSVSALHSARANKSDKTLKTRGIIKHEDKHDDEAVKVEFVEKKPTISDFMSRATKATSSGNSNSIVAKILLKSEDTTPTTCTSDTA